MFAFFSRHIEDMITERKAMEEKTTDMEQRLTSLVEKVCAPRHFALIKKPLLHRLIRFIEYYRHYMTQ